MRKLLLLCAIMLATIGALAQTAYEGIQNGFYMIQGRAVNKDVCAKYNGTRIIHEDLSEKDFVNCVFYFEKGSGNKYTIRLKDGKYLTYKGTGKFDQIEIKNESEVTDNNKWWQIFSGNVTGKLVIVPDQAGINWSTPGFNFSVTVGDETNAALGLWDCNDGNSQWSLVSVASAFANGKAKIKVQNIFLKKDGAYLKKGDDTNCELFTLTKDTQKNRYTIQTSDGAYLTYSATTNGTQVTFGVPTDENKWWVIERNYGTSSEASYPVDIFPYQTSYSENTAAWNFAIKVNNVANAALGLWNANGNASYCELFWETESVLTDIAENVHRNKEYGVAGFFEPTFAGVAGYSLENKSFGEGQFTADITFPVPVSSETVSNPTFISSYNYSSQSADQFKWYASDNKIKVKEEEEIFSSSIASHLWLIYPKFNNGAFTFQIKNVATGLFINSSGEVGHDDQSTVKLSDEATEFTIGVRNGEGHEFINNSEKWLSVNTSTPNGKIQTVGTYGRSHNGTALTFPVPGFNVTIGATGYATLYSPITVLPEAGNQTLEIYQIVSAPKNNSVTLYQIHYVHKNQGVILKGNSDTKYWFALTDWDSFSEEYWKYNKLKGSYVDTYVAGPAYVLANEEENGVGLYKAKLNKDANGATGTTHFKNNAGKAYLPASPAASDARFLVFNFGDDVETGITETENGNVKTENTEVYDLSGRRVLGAQKGIFIVNGKKVVR